MTRPASAVSAAIPLAQIAAKFGVTRPPAAGPPRRYGFNGREAAGWDPDSADNGPGLARTRGERKRRPQGGRVA